MSSGRSRLIIIVAVTVAILVTPIVVASYQDRGEEHPGVEDPRPRVHYIEVVHPPYGTLERLAEETTLVVVGTVIEVLPARRVVPEGIDLSQLPPEKAANLGYLETDIRVHPEETVWINPHRPTVVPFSNEIVVTQLGGATGQDLYVVEEHPLSDVGRRYVFFLSENTDHPRYTGHEFTIVGGPNGHFVVQEGILSAFRGEGHPAPPLAERYDGVPVTKLRADLAAIR